MELIDPTLLVTLLSSERIDVGHDTDYLGDVASLGLSTAHATEARGDEEGDGVLGTTGGIVHHTTGGIEDRDRRAVDDALRADIHIGTSRHLSVLAHAEGVHALPVVGLGVVGDDHTVGDDHSRCALV